MTIVPQNDENSPILLSSAKIIKRAKKQIAQKIQEMSNSVLPFASSLIDVLYASLLLLRIEEYENKDSPEDEKRECDTDDYLIPFIKYCVKNVQIQKELRKLKKIIDEIENIHCELQPDEEPDTSYKPNKKKRHNPKTKYRYLASELDKKRKQKIIPKLDTKKTKSNKFL